NIALRKRRGEHLRWVADEAGESSCIFEDLTQRVRVGELVGRNACTREAMRPMCRALQEKGYAPPAVVMPPDDFVPPSAVVPTQHDRLWRMTVQAEIQRAQSGLRGQRWSQLYTNAGARDCQTDETQVQHRELAQLFAGHRRTQP